MANTPEPISYIKLNDGLDPHPIDALFVGEKSAAEIGELVTSISGSSTDSQYPSAKCIYEIIYGENGESSNSVNTNYLVLDVSSFNSLVYDPPSGMVTPNTGSGTVIEVGSGFNTSDLVNNSPIVYFSNNQDIASGSTSSIWMGQTRYRVVFSNMQEAVYEFTFNSNTNPTSYTFSRAHSGGGGRD